VKGIGNCTVDADCGANRGLCITSVDYIYIIKGDNTDPSLKDRPNGVTFYEDGGSQDKTKALIGGRPSSPNMPRFTGPLFYPLSSTMIGQHITFGDPDELLKKKGLMDTSPTAGQNTCMESNYSYPCTGSIKFNNDNFAAVFYAQNQNGQNKTCRVYNDSISDLATSSILFDIEDGITTNNQIYRTDIFPTMP
jgi:hypothetical protein